MPRYPSTTPTLFIIGGAEDRVGKASLLRQFVKLAGGRRARLVLIPTASSFQDEVVASYTEVFTRLGAPGVDGREPRDPGRVARPRPGRAGRRRHRHLHERRQPAAALAAASRHAARRGAAPGARARRRRRRHLGRRLDHERLHDLDGRGGRHAAPARQPDLGRARPGPGRRRRPALRPAHPLRPADVRDRPVAAPARHRIDEDTAIVVTDHREFTVRGTGAVFVVDCTHRA